MSAAAAPSKTSAQRKTSFTTERGGKSKIRGDEKKAILTSSLGGYYKVNGVRMPTPLPQTNGLLDRLKAIWPENANVLFICADPTDHKKNDNIRACFSESFPMSGLGISSVGICDGRNPEAARHLDKTDVLVLTGGHVPTQNRFMKTLRLRERLSGFGGVILAWSAGSMNCADVVYAGPELEGEALDPHYERWLPGLGITDVNIFPHMQALRGTFLDGMRLIEDITFADSFGHAFIALNDGSYITIADGKTTLYGEAYAIKDGRQTQICWDGRSVSL